MTGFKLRSENFTCLGQAEKTKAGTSPGHTSGDRVTSVFRETAQDKVRENTTGQTTMDFEH